jgi:hypothetical protein
MWTMRDPSAFYPLIAQIQPLLLLALVVELRQGQRSRRWMNRRTSTRGTVVRIVIAVIAGCGMLYLGLVEFFCIAMTASSDQPFSAEMDAGLFATLTMPVGALLLLTGTALISEMFGEESANAV